MVDPNFSWIYLLVFLAIPLARIIPRLLARGRAQRGDGPYPQAGGRPSDPGRRGSGPTPFSAPAPEPGREPTPPPPQSRPQSPPRSPKPQTMNMLVLGVLHRGSKTFEDIQKNTGLDSDTLDGILKDLEDRGLMGVRQKQGLMGSRVELYPTDKGFKEYYS